MTKYILIAIMMCFMACSFAVEDNTESYSKIEVLRGHRDTVNATGDIYVTITDTEVIIDVNASEVREDTTIVIKFTETYPIDTSIITNGTQEYYSDGYTVVKWDSKVGLFAGEFFNYIIRK